MYKRKIAATTIKTKDDSRLRKRRSQHDKHIQREINYNPNKIEDIMKITCICRSLKTTLIPRGGARVYWPVSTDTDAEDKFPYSYNA